MTDQRKRVKYWVLRHGNDYVALHLTLGIAATGNLVRAFKFHTRKEALRCGVCYYEPEAVR